MVEGISRRHFLWGSAASFALLASYQAHCTTVPAGPMEPWQRGFLDIHHISTGRGNSVLAICPDGTSIMVDAGATKGPTDALGPARPDASRRPGEWIGRYALHHLRTAPKRELDYFVLTHFHGDHMGEITTDSPVSSKGDYRLSGVADVAELIPVRQLIDRGYPSYDYPAPATYDATLNYIRFARAAEKHGTKVARLQVGSSRQIALQHAPSECASVAIRNLAANGDVWTGQGEEVKHLFPPLSTLKPQEYPTENACSMALKFSYGAFSYYIGGDLTCDTLFGTEPWMDAESAVAKVAGPVNVAAVDHHGYYDATGPEFVRAMRSRIYVIQTWHATHPALQVLDRLYSPILYPGDRDVLATGMVPAAALADARLSDRMLSQQGHVVVRVLPGGDQYEVIVLDDTMEEGKVKARFGPYVA
jgi:beta-lactamase superfamily II metal-dependent hydrolase